MHYVSEVKGECGIVARVVAKSFNPLLNKTITTFELEYPRYVHSEFMTHRQFSRNAASSRAIPVANIISQVWNNPATPVHWGENMPGMQAKTSLKGFKLKLATLAWHGAAKAAAAFAWAMNKVKLHKQVANRVLEPFQIMKTVMTTTELENFYWLREHPDADPTIRELAKCMSEADQLAYGLTLESGEWHTPYYGNGVWDKTCKESLQDALAISSSCCAQVSFRKLDDGLDKARNIYKRLVESEPVHASPFEHAATPISPDAASKPPSKWPKGVTHKDRSGRLWSGNLCGYVQYRQLIPNNVKN